MNNLVNIKNLEIETIKNLKIKALNTLNLQFGFRDFTNFC